MRAHIPAGTYYLGDPCYAIKDKDWIPLLNSADYFDGKCEGVTPSGLRVIAFGTAYGDGVYRDQFGDNYWVDAGLIGLVPYSKDLESKYGGRLTAELGKKVVFEHDDEAFENETGILNFGKYVINTQCTEDDEYDETAGL